MICIVLAGLSLDSMRDRVKFSPMPLYHSLDTQIGIHMDWPKVKQDEAGEILNVGIVFSVQCVAFGLWFMWWETSRNIGKRNILPSSKINVAPHLVVSFSRLLLSLDLILQQDPAPLMRRKGCYAERKLICPGHITCFGTALNRAIDTRTNPVEISSFWRKYEVMSMVVIYQWKGQLDK